jgi:bifunctional DNA-binding transcriptional regulator/antitoxin component of YhaV-PrlF toxin-antitoxin module
MKNKWSVLELATTEEGVKTTRKLDTRNRITIPQDICEFLDLKSGNFVEITIKKAKKPD